MFFSIWCKRLTRMMVAWVRRLTGYEAKMLALGRLLSLVVCEKTNINSLCDVEFRVFSQYGDDGIIQWLVNNIDLQHKTFIEFGVEDYRESNTRFLMMHDNWSGLVMDGSAWNIGLIRKSEYFWQYDLEAKCAFIDCDNVNELIAASGFRGEIGLLHIDIDGNDYWVWKAIDVVRPAIVIVEYNSVFGDRPVTVPYREDFSRGRAHFSNLYFGASLSALCLLAKEKGYAFIGSNRAGNNAFFVRRDKLNGSVCEIPYNEGYVFSKFRESRDLAGRLTYISGAARPDVIRGMPVFNVVERRLEPF